MNTSLGINLTKNPKILNPQIFDLEYSSLPINDRECYFTKNRGTI